MKHFGIILLGLLCSIPSLAQSVQSGLVLEYNGSLQKTPLSDVVITAGNAPIVTSDAEGQFSLSFRTLHAGDAIQFRRIERAGYEVMNTEALEAARVARNNDNANLLRPQDARTEGSNPNS